MEGGVFNLILILLFASVAVVPVFQRAGLGAVLGYLVIGAVLGPRGLAFFYDAESVLHIAEMGVVFLLFLVGLELKPSRLWAMRNSIFGLGSLQLLGSTVAIGALGMLTGWSWREGIILGLALSLSSTAMSLQLLSERNQLNTSFGRAAFAILLFQDIAAIPLLACLSLMKPGVTLAFDVQQVVFVAVVLALFLMLGRKALVPWFRFAASAKLREVFTAAALLVVLGSAVVMERVGLSMALGTFLAGILLSESEFRHELESDLEPFKGLLLGLFFMGVGMSIDTHLLLANPIAVLGGTLGWMLVKFVVTYAVAFRKSDLRSGAGSLAQVLCVGGEFAFVTLSAAVKLDVVSPELSELCTLSVATSMMLTPLTFFFRDTWTGYLGKQRTKEFDALPSNRPVVILAGYGRVGQIVGRMLRVHDIPHTALELDPAQVTLVRRFGTEIYYGDASRLDLLEAAGTSTAKLFVLAVDDVDASLRVAKMVREKFPGLPILARARNRTHALELHALGIQHVFRETLASSFEMAEQALLGLGYEPARANRIVKAFRAQDEETLRQQQAHMGDEKGMIRAAQQGMQQLAELLKSDKPV